MKRPTAPRSATLASLALLIGVVLLVGAAAGSGAAQDTAEAKNATQNVTGNVTIDTVGENVTVETYDNVTVQDPTVYLGPNVSTNDSQVTVQQEYFLGGRVAGWQGVAPEAINGTVNPTLNLTAGEQYAITWVNLDGARHNVAVTNAANETFAATPIITEEGAAQTLVFEVPDEPGTYYCEAHPNTMRGEIVLEMNATA